jgi:23S rRNA (guanosine2251-2'-O)-methyltransferase
LRRGEIDIREIWVAEETRTQRLDEILMLARDRGVRVRARARSEISQALPGTLHQGIVAVLRAFTYADLEEVVQSALARKGQGLLIAADHITDEGNLGAMIRTLAFFGADGLVLPRERSAGITPSVIKRSSGGCFHVPVAQVVNLGRTLHLLARRGFWIIGASGEAPETIHRFDWNRDVVLVLGNEQKGLSRAARGQCHTLVGIPRRGSVEALNVSVACGIILSEIMRQRSAGESG